MGIYKWGFSITCGKLLGISWYNTYMKITRKWAMPSHKTFTIKPISEFYSEMGKKSALSRKKKKNEIS